MILTGDPINAALQPSIFDISNGKNLTVYEYTRYINLTDGYIYYVTGSANLVFNGVIHYDYENKITSATNTFENLVSIETSQVLKNWLDTTGIENFIINDGNGYVGLFNSQSDYNPQNANIFHYKGKTINSVMTPFIVSDTNQIPTTPSNSVLYFMSNSWTDANNNVLPCYNAMQVIPNLEGKYLAVEVKETKDHSYPKVKNGQSYVWQEDEIDLYLINGNVNDAMVLKEQVNNIQGLGINEARIPWVQSNETQPSSLIKTNERKASFTCNYWIATDLTTPIVQQNIESASSTSNYNYLRRF